MGLTLEVSGQSADGATLLVANHVSWLDICAIHAVAPQARFVSKVDVLSWPLLGWLIRGAGTLFIERDRRRDALRVVHAMAAALQAGDTVAVFPEGTTGQGPSLLPFHANLLQAALSTGTRVQAVALRYADAERRYSDAVEFVGETTLLQSVWRVATADRLAVYVDLLPALPTVGLDRRTLAAQLHRLITTRLHRQAPITRGCGALPPV